MPLIPSFEDFPSMSRPRSFHRRIPIEIVSMEPPVLGKAASAYFFPEPEDPRIPRGIVECRKRAFSGGDDDVRRPSPSRPVEFSVAVRTSKSPAPVDVVEQPSPSAWIRSPHPPPIPRRVKIDVVHLGVTAPAEMLAAGPSTSGFAGPHTPYKTIRYRREAIDERPTSADRSKVLRSHFNTPPRRFPVVTVNVSQPQDGWIRTPTATSRMSQRVRTPTFAREEIIERQMEVEEHIEYTNRQSELQNVRKKNDELKQTLIELREEKRRLQVENALNGPRADEDAFGSRERGSTSWATPSPSSTRCSSRSRRRATMISEIDRMQQELAKKESMGVEMNPPGVLNNNSGSQGSSRRPSDDRSIGSDSSQIMSMHEQIVKYSVGGASSPDRETNLVVRLERELTDAQQCNHRLNQQIKLLANGGNATIKKELTDTKFIRATTGNEAQSSPVAGAAAGDLQKQLKDKTTEVEQLRKEKAQWQARQPSDVQALHGEKQELRKQLEREQSEKHELFMQINSMIAQLADAGDSHETERLRSELNSLRRETDALKMGAGAEASRSSSELQRVKEQLEALKRSNEQDVRRLEAELDEKQRQLDIKSASIQSLMLAKQDTTRADILVEENDRLSRELDEIRSKWAQSTSEVVDKQAEIMRLRDAQSVSDATRSRADEVQQRMREVESRLHEEQTQKDRLRMQVDELKMTLASSEESLSRLKTKITKFEEDATSLRRENEQLQMAQSSDSQRIRFEFEDEIRSLGQKIEILETTLREKDQKIDRTKVSLLSAESRAQQAELDLKTMESRAHASERKEQQLVAQLQAQGDSGAQVDLLRGELSRSEERHQLVLARLQKTESSIQEKEAETRRRADSLESSAEEARRLHEQLEELRREKQDAVVAVQLKVTSLEAELAHAKQRLNEQNSELSDARRNIESKASVADEIKTLMTSLEFVRHQNTQYEEEIRGLEKEMREMREEIYQKQDECADFKRRAERAEAENSHEKERNNLNEDSRLQLVNEKRRLEEHLEKLREEKETIRRELTEANGRLKGELAEAAISADRRIKEVQERCDALQRESESSKSRVQQLQEEQSRFVGSQDSMKQQLLDDARAYQDKAEQLSLELGNVSFKLTNVSDELSREKENSQHLEKHLKQLQKEYDDLRIALQTSEEQADRMREAEQFSLRVRQQLEELESEHSRTVERLKVEHEQQLESARGQRQHEKGRVLEEQQRLVENVTEEHRKALAKSEEEVRELREELRKARTEHKSLEDVFEEHQTALIKNRAETDELMELVRVKEMALSSSNDEKSKVQRELDELRRSLAKVRDEQNFVDEMRQESSRLTVRHEEERREWQRELDDLREQLSLQRLNIERERSDSTADEERSRRKILELEAKLEATTKSNESLMNNVQEMTRLVESEARRVDEVAREKKRWQEDADRLQHELDESRIAGVSTERTNELLAENARLAGELLKAHSQAERSVASERESVARQFDDKLKNANAERTRLASDLQAALSKQKVLESRIEDQRVSLDSAEKRRRDESRELNSLRDERISLKAEVEKLQTNGPTAPPRSVRTISNMSSITNYTTSNDFSDVDDVTRLRAEIEKQRRLIVVLRRKLQGMQQ